MRPNPHHAVPTLLAVLLAGAVHAQGGRNCGTWQVEPSPNPGPVHNGLMEIAVRAPDDVLVLGGSNGGGGLFLTHWDGAGFSPIAWPSLSNNATLEAMKPVGDHVWLAGLQVADSPFFSDPLMIRWDGTDWDRIDTLELLPQTVFPFNNRNGSGRALDGVAEDDVWVVGTAAGWGAGGGVSVPMTLHWDGSEWTEFLTEAASDGSHSLDAVDMVSPDDGWAVGVTNSPSAPGFGIIYRWDGTAWTHAPNPIADLDFSQLNDVVAIAADDVWVVGDRNGVPLFGHYDGSGWTVTEIPGSVAASVGEIAAVASDDIWAVSYFQPGYYHYDGFSWETMGGPDVPGSVTVNRGGDLEVVGPCDIWSVGGWDNGTVQSTLLERLRIDDTPNGADVNGDGCVNVDDIVMVILAWGSGDPAADVDHDGFVGIDDVVRVIMEWSPCP